MRRTERDVDFFSIEAERHLLSDFPHCLHECFLWLFGTALSRQQDHLHHEELKGLGVIIVLCGCKNHYHFVWV